jgi:membrane protein implicated in regulation of membrane protease activity
MINARLIITLISNLIWEGLIVAAAVWVLPLAGIHLPWWSILIITVAFAIYAAVMYRMGNRVLGKKALPGSTDMLGVKGRVVKKLAPAGIIKIEGELWEATAESGTIEAGVEVTVTGQKGLKLEVRAIRGL